MSNGETESTDASAALFERQPWGRGDLLALLVWTVAIAVVFWDSVSLRRALFYFDITEINYPYRAFSPTSFAPGVSRDGAPGSTAACRFIARARRAICIRSSTCFIPGCRPGRRSTSTRCFRSG